MVSKTTRWMTVVVVAGVLVGGCASRDTMMGGDKMGGDKAMSGDKMTGDTMMKDDMKQDDTMMEKK